MFQKVRCFSESLLFGAFTVGLVAVAVAVADIVAFAVVAFLLSP